MAATMMHWSKQGQLLPTTLPAFNGDWQSNITVLLPAWPHCLPNRLGSEGFLSVVAISGREMTSSSGKLTNWLSGTLSPYKCSSLDVTCKFVLIMATFGQKHWAEHHTSFPGVGTHCLQYQSDRITGTERTKETSIQTPSMDWKSTCW